MTLTQIANKIRPELKAYGIKRASVFGSVARGEARSNSDIDILVSLGKPMGMFKYMEFVGAIEKKLKRKVDIVTEKSLNKFVKPYIIKDLKLIFTSK